jgi:MftR C-terminal domain
MVQRIFRDRIDDALAQRRGLAPPDDRAVVATSVGQAVMHLAFDRWALTDGHEDLETLLRDHFSLVGLIQQPGTKPGRRRR